MTQLLNNNRLTIINFIIVTYFAGLYLINLYNVDFVLVGVFRELLTIPFLLAQLLFLVLGTIFLITNKNRRLLTTISLVLLAICSLLTIGSFF